MKRQSVKMIDCHIGKRLRILRHQNGMSLEVLAGMLGVSQQQVSRYELGQHRLSAAQLYRLSCYFSVPLSWFFYGYQKDASEEKVLDSAIKERQAKYGVTNPKEAAEDTTEKERALVLAWRSLPTEIQQDRILALLEAFG